MNTQNDILDELRSWNSPLAGMSRKMPFAVPSGYFEGFHKDIHTILKESATEDPRLTYSKVMPYQLPEGYFSSLPGEMLAIAKEESSLLQARAPFEVPEGYFSQLPAQLLAAAKAADVPEEKKTKVISPNWKTLWTSTRWAAAAILILGIAFSTYTGLQRPTSVENQLSSLPEGTISEYVAQNIDEFDMDMIESTVVANETKPTVSDVSELSDEEIIQYLNETGWDKDNIN